MSATSNQDYFSTFIAFLNRQEYYIKGFSTGLKSNAKLTAMASAEDFFESDVRGGFYALRYFSEVLYEILTSGRSVTLTIRGFAARGSAYNRNLAVRRVDSVINHFRNFDGEIYRIFIASGQLVLQSEIITTPQGPYNSANSMFDPKIMREHRVEITGMQITSSNK